MRHSLPIAPQFYVTAPQPCPYLEGRKERKLFTALNGSTANQLNNSLSQQGFRRSQNVLYRPTCADCNACLSARIDVSKFKISKNQKRVRKRNKDLERAVNSPWASDDQFDLFKRYLNHRHATGGMADMDIYEFASMIEETPIKTRVIEYANDDLIAVCLTDILDDGLSMVYSFYEPEEQDRSLGTELILDHVDMVKEAGLQYVYLGYWVPTSPKMHYKSRFSGLEIFFKGKWQPIGDPKQYSTALHPMNAEPISEQVASLILPQPDNNSF